MENLNDKKNSGVPEGDLQILQDLLIKKEQELVLLRQQLAEAKHNESINIDHLSRSEKRYRDLFNYGQALICTHDKNGVVLTVNPAICKVLGFSEAELVGNNIAELLPPQAKTNFKANYLDVINKEGVAKGLFTIITKNGGAVYLLFQNYKVQEPGIEPYIIGFSQDITDRKKAEQALKRSEEKYRGIIENMNLGLLEVDTEERIIYANHSFCQMCGYDIDELAGRVASDVFATGNNVLRLWDKAELRTSGISDAYEMAVRNKKGEPKWWLISAAPLYDSHGKQIGSVGIHLDITKQKVLEYKLLEAKQEAEDSARAKELFLTNMSHEIRTPMNAIMGMGRQLQKTPLNIQQQFFLETINAASGNLLVIIDDILDLSKIESGRLSLQLAPFNFAGLVDKAILIIAQKAAEKGITVTKKVDADLATVLKGDPQRLGQVINNLLSNALKFTERGEIIVECAVLQDKDNRQVVQITVKDTGLGMSKEFLKIVFNKFSQEDEGSVRKYGGTGLGMSISKHLIEAMGGKISVESEKGVGTTVHFIVSLEKGLESELPKTSLAVAPEDVLKGVTVLLVEDNEMNRMVANTVLVQYGASVDEALNGLDAIDTLRKKSYDIVLMDIRMPVMDGIEATRVIREEISKTLPIIALTANVVKGEKEKCIQAGMNEFIGKPFDENDLIRAIAKYTEREVAPNTQSEDNSIVQAPLPLYDLTKLWDISRGKQAFVEKMVSIFITETTNAIQDIMAAYEARNTEKINSVAHKIKPSLYNLNVHLIKNDILLLEHFGKEGETNDADLKALVDKVTSVLTQVVERMKNTPIVSPA